MVYRDYTIFLKYSATSMYHNYFEIQTEVKQHSLKKLQDIPTQFVKKTLSVVSPSDIYLRHKTTKCRHAWRTFVMVDYQKQVSSDRRKKC